MVVTPLVRVSFKARRGNHVYRVVNQRNVKTHTRALSRRAERLRKSSDVGRIQGGVAGRVMVTIRYRLHDRRDTSTDFGAL